MENELKTKDPFGKTRLSERIYNGAKSNQKVSGLKMSAVRLGFPARTQVMPKENYCIMSSSKISLNATSLRSGFPPALKNAKSGNETTQEPE